jgi:hypothetical protein
MSKSKGAPASIASPTLKPIQGLVPVKQWDVGGELHYCFEESEEVIRASGLVPENISYPSASTRACTPGHRYSPLLKLSRLKDGRIRLKISVTRIIAQDIHFTRFVGTLLADFRLSLVKGESA